MRYFTLLFLFALGCGHHPSERPPRAYEDASALMAGARARALPTAVSGSYGIHVESAVLGIDGTTKGGLVIERPNRFRLDIISPFGTPLVYAVSDGVGFSVFVVNKNALYSTPDAEALLREASGGAAGLEDIVAVFVGKVPFEGREVTGVQAGDGETVFSFAGPEGTRAEVALDDSDATTRRIAAYDAEGAMALTATYQDYQRVGESRLPGEVLVTVPALGLEVKLSFKSWTELAQAPDVFSVPAQPGVEPIDLGELLTRAREGTLQAPVE